MAENHLETPKAPAVEANGSAELKMSHEAGTLLREQPVQSKDSAAAGNEVDGKFGTPEIDFGSKLTSGSANEKSGVSEPDRAGKEFIDNVKSMQGAEQLEASDTNAILGNVAKQAMDGDPVKEGIDLADEHFPGNSEEDVEKRNSAFLALMKMKGEPALRI